MKIYQCKSEDVPSLVPILEELGLSYEETLRDGAAMARAAERVREVNGMNHVVVPLSECLMTACLGTAITWDPELGDRVAKEVFADWSEAESFRPESIRRELLDPLFEAIRILKEARRGGQAQPCARLGVQAGGCRHLGRAFHALVRAAEAAGPGAPQRRDPLYNKGRS